MHAQQGHAAAAPRQRHAPSFAGTRLWNSALLGQEERDALAQAASPARTVRANTDLIREGERSDTLFIVIDGWACRYTTTRDGARQLSALLLPGDVANLDSLMFDQPDYGVRSFGDVTVVGIAVDRVRALAAQHPGIARTLTWLAVIENAILGRWTQSLGRRSAKERLAHLLCELSVRLHAEQGNESGFPFPMTQEQLADALGLTAVHVNRTMQQLRDEGAVRTANRMMILPDIPRLRQLGGFDPFYLHLGPPRGAAQMSD